MKTLPYFFLFVFFMMHTADAQKYFTKTAVITFESNTPMEKISATNKSGTCVTDFGSGNVEFAVLVKGFQFEKALMQEHFNENYMESSKFPKAVYKGKIEGVDKIDLTKNGKHKVKTSGQLTMHGVTKPVSCEVQLEVKEGKILASTNFTVAVADYGIVIPALVRDNVAKNVAVKVQANLEPLK
jgi:hypothetical protein